MTNDWQKLKGHEREATAVREVAAAYRLGNERLELERFEELRSATPETLAEQFDQLLELGVALLPNTLEEWELFESERELVHFQSAARLVRARSEHG